MSLALKYKQSGPLFFLRNSFYTYVSIGAGSCWCMAARNLLQTNLKKVTSTDSLCFKMARGGKWLRVAADGCNQLQPLTATCSHLPKQPLAATCPSSHLRPLAATCSHLQPLAATCSHLLMQPLAATCSHLQPLAATCSHLQPLAQVAASGCKQVTAFRKSK